MIQDTIENDSNEWRLFLLFSINGSCFAVFLHCKITTNTYIVAKSSLFYLFLMIVQINVILSDNVYEWWLIVTPLAYSRFDSNIVHFYVFFIRLTYFPCDGQNGTRFSKSNEKDNQFEHNLLKICRYLTLQIPVVIFLIIKYLNICYPYTGAVFQATTNSYKRVVSGVVFGYDENKVRLWVPIDDPSRNGNGKYIFLWTSRFGLL